jgi:hypothetical protein
METKEKNTIKDLPKGYTMMDPAKAEKYAKMDLFREKFDKNNELIRRVGLPSELTKGK